MPLSPPQNAARDLERGLGPLQDADVPESDEEDEGNGWIFTMADAGSDMEGPPDSPTTGNEGMLIPSTK